MLERLQVDGLKSLQAVDVTFKPLTVLFGPNAAGKSNLLQAIDLLSHAALPVTLSQALTWQERGYPFEYLALPDGGVPALLAEPEGRFTETAEVRCDDGRRLRYSLQVGIAPATGEVRVCDESLVEVSQRGRERRKPTIELVGDRLHVRRRGKPAHPHQEPVGLGQTIVSDHRFGGELYPEIAGLRRELLGWTTYYLDPGLSMRRAAPPAAVNDIGRWGQDLAPFLNRLRQSPEHGKLFGAVVRSVRSLVPSIQDVTVDLDERRGLLELQVRQDGRPYSSRVISEGTLRVLALCAVAVNPWSGRVVALEEPENGVHPARLDLLAELLGWMATDGGRQVVVTSHSPAFIAAVHGLQQQQPEAVALLTCRRANGVTRIEPFTEAGLFRDAGIADGLRSPSEDGTLQAMLLRGWLDG